MTKEKNDMSKEYNFKVGDKVRLIEFPGMNPYYKGRILEIASIDNNGYVTFKEGRIHPKVWELEPVEPLDRRTAFLTRLQSLLREFDAHIEPCGCEIEGLSIVLKDNEEIYYKMDDFSPMRNLTADNIMDFDKE